ncbi:MAG: protein-glutamine glutaminase family protein, partial [Myxococcota bacterium]
RPPLFAPPCPPLPPERLLLENLHGLNLDLGPPLTATTAAHWFDEIARLPDVPWELIDDGCGERAMIASMHLARHGVRSLKVFVVGDLMVPSATEPVEWSFHVAPAVMVEERGRWEMRIFDPALAKHPLSLSAWLSRFVSGPIVVDVLPWFQRNAVEWGGFEREEDAESHLANAREALEEVVAEWHQERATRALEEAAAMRSEKVGGERPILSY